MKSLLHKMLRIERELAASKGPFTFFGLLQREDAGGLWDVVASAPWISRRDRTAAIPVIIDLIKRDLTPGELMEISHVVPLPPGEEWIRNLEIEPVNDGAPVELYGREFSGIETRRAWILAYNPALVAEDGTRRGRVKTQRGATRSRTRRAPAGA
jgi:hypothetical protein